MNASIIIGMGVVLLLFIWSWIGLVLVSRISLERKIEKLSNITNPLPEEEEALAAYRDLRDLERGKILGAKWLMAFFMLLLVGSLCAAPWWPPLYELFGSQILSQYVMAAFALLTFFCLPIYVGLSLANPKKGGRKKGQPAPVENVPVKAPAKAAVPAPVVEKKAEKAPEKAAAAA